MKMQWFSINDKEEHCLMLSIEECLVRDDPNRDYSDEYSSEKISRFVAGCYKAHKMEFKIRVITPLFLSPHVTYRVNLVFHYSKIKQMKQQSFPLMYKLLGGTKISMVNVADMRGDGRLVAQLYRFTNEGDKSILDLEIIFEDSGLSGYFYIEGINFQPLGRVEHPVVVAEYEEILKASVIPLFHRSTEEIKLLLTNGILLTGDKLFCLNEKGEHIERLFIEACLDPKTADTVKHQDDCVDSRFPGGRYYRYDAGFKAHVRAEYLTSHISYTVNLVFRYTYESHVNSYNPMRYKIEGEDETKVFIINPSTHMRDGWFIAPLYQFTSQHKTADLQFQFEFRSYHLSVTGIEFQPSEEKVELQVFEEYQDIVEVASQSIFYTSLDELKQILSKGVYLNGNKTWFSLNEKGEHCHMISMKDCLIPYKDFAPRYKSDYCSRFPAGLYQTKDKGFKICVNAKLLSPNITYTVNLVYKSRTGGEQQYVDLKYRLRGEATTIVYLANRRKELHLYMAELYQFTSNGSIADLEIIFENSGAVIDRDVIDGVEGIMFQPLEIVEDQVSKEDKVENVQTVSDSESDTYWEQKLTHDYEEILNLSKDSLQWTKKKELYSILRRGFLIDNDQQWFAIDKHEKKYLMLSARVAWVIDDNNSACESSHESRFGEVLIITASHKFEIKAEIRSDGLSFETNYASYLVYKLPEDQSTFEAPLCVWNERVYLYPHRYIYLVSPPHTPVIGPMFDENTYNPLNRYKRNAIPQQRTDGWMEVKVWEFQTTKSVPMHIYFEHPDKKNLKGLIVQGIELRPV
ncbi:protein kinase domain, Nitrogen network kinase 1, Phloem protein 2-like protein [Artemisia annua]|uniref:Protein kinase domain, Nitrogen network kinase 1, Phloem protein 2-like protein n=1 Tax=Artemisia annua TaxID=35608 RepID=A0A2U1KX72_ARTAN|nr:protein kinase domain, Nitrogen network kinase 1, Phloem protein 2-like protein [Artemisia annua]